MIKFKQYRRSLSSGDLVLRRLANSLLELLDLDLVRLDRLELSMLLERFLDDWLTFILELPGLLVNLLGLSRVCLVFSRLRRGLSRL